MGKEEAVFCQCTSLATEKGCYNFIDTPSRSFVIFPGESLTPSRNNYGSWNLYQQNRIWSNIICFKKNFPASTNGNTEEYPLMNAILEQVNFFIKHIY